MARPPRATRSDYALFSQLTTRWADNDAYGHMNNVVYYQLVDTVVNSWLRDEAGMKVPGGDVIGLVVETGCVYHASLGWPEPVDGGLVVERIGNTSITYLVGVFGANSDEAAGEARFTHVYVDAETRRPVAIPDNLREAATRILKKD
ncbi:MAG: thioesterase [Ponticaulis sp.]|nr:thioesterase [Ponticaulis sp.]